MKDIIKLTYQSIEDEWKTYIVVISQSEDMCITEYKCREFEYIRARNECPKNFTVSIPALIDAITDNFKIFGLKVKLQRVVNLDETL
jgi:hypothetical protein